MTPVSVPSRAEMMPGSDRRSRAKTKRSKAARVGASRSSPAVTRPPVMTTSSGS